LIEHEELVTHNYVVVEAVSLAHRRIGWAAARDLLDGILPLLEVVWIDEAMHRAGESAFLSGRSKLSLVDYISFEVMRRRAIRSAFAFDRDFRRQGFRTIP
jgi:predicted nucleic acid-binding protein